MDYKHIVYCFTCKLASILYDTIDSDTFNGTGTGSIINIIITKGRKIAFPET